MPRERLTAVIDADVAELVADIEHLSVASLIDISDPQQEEAGLPILLDSTDDKFRGLIQDIASEDSFDSLEPEPQVVEVDEDIPISRRADDLLTLRPAKIVAFYNDLERCRRLLDKNLPKYYNIIVAPVKTRVTALAIRETVTPAFLEELELSSQGITSLCVALRERMSRFNVEMSEDTEQYLASM
jgi:hypothetical protein